MLIGEQHVERARFVDSRPKSRTCASDTGTEPGRDLSHAFQFFGSALQLTLQGFYVLRAARPAPGPAVRAFCDWLEAEGHMTTNRARG